MTEDIAAKLMRLMGSWTPCSPEFVEDCLHIGCAMEAAADEILRLRREAASAEPRVSLRRHRAEVERLTAEVLRLREQVAGWREYRDRWLTSEDRAEKAEAALARVRELAESYNREPYDTYWAYGTYWAVASEIRAAIEGEQ